MPPFLYLRFFAACAAAEEFFVPCGHEIFTAFSGGSYSAPRCRDASSRVRRTSVLPQAKPQGELAGTAKRRWSGPWNGRALPGHFSQIWGPRKSDSFCGAFRADRRGEVSPLGASSFALGGKGTKTPSKNPWFLGISFFPLDCVLLSPARGHRKDSLSRLRRYALLWCNA